MGTSSRIAGVGVLALALSGLVQAQAPQPTQAPQAAQPAAGRLPVRRVVLYKSGVGYFEHLGRIRGNQTVTIDFTSAQLDDVLKSLTALDLDGGRVLGVSYNSEAGLDRRLGALRLPVGAETNRAEFFNALRGARVEVRSGATRLAGRLLSVERIDRKTDAGITQADTISVVSDTGEIQTFTLDAGVSVRLLEADLNQEVGRYLSLVASVRDQDLRRVSISTSGTGDRNLFVSYISEVPIWKPTYRIVLPDAATPRKPLLQGWAIIDNTVGEDWNSVELSLVAGSPQSFVQAISQPQYVQRPVVPLPQHVSATPQTHQAALGTAGAGAISGTVTDSQGSALPGVTVNVMRNGLQVAMATVNTTGRYSASGLAAATYTVRFELSGFKTMNYPNVEVSGGMETLLDARLELGGVMETVTVSGAAPVVDMKNMSIGGSASGAGGRGGGAGRAAPPPPASMPAPPPPPAQPSYNTFAAQQAEAAAAQLGDLFEYKLKAPVTIPKNQSALVPILAGDVDAVKVSLWNPSSGPRPLRAVWLTNSTGLTLDGGSFSVIEGQAFAGEGLMDPLKAGEKRLLSYAVDLGMQVDAKGEPVPTKTTKVTIARGVLIQTTEERQKRIYTVRNEDTEARVLVLEHPVRPGWTIGGSLTPAESTAVWHRFRVPVAAKTTATFTVEESRPGQTQIAVNSITDNQIAVLVKDQLITPELEASLRRIQAQKAEVARLANEMAARQGEVSTIGRDQDRVRENLKSLKGTDAEKQLVQRYVKQLDEQENRLVAIRKEMEKLDLDRKAAQAELDRLIAALSTSVSNNQ